jgi:hypothetical protein
MDRMATGCSHGGWFTLVEFGDLYHWFSLMSIHCEYPHNFKKPVDRLNWPGFMCKSVLCFFNTSGYPWRSDTIRPCLALRTWVSGPRETDTGFQDLEKRTLGFRTSTDGQLGSGFQDLETKRKAKKQRKERLPPLLFPEENPFVCPSVRPSVRAGSAIENASRWSVIDRAGSAVENASRTPNHPRT